jgi:aminoglycoside phosphotransferase (APT) family kinase protein
MMGLDRQIALILAAMPELAAAPFSSLGEGWDSVAIAAGDRFVFKFPKSETARQALIREASLLAVIRPRLQLAVPDMRIVGRDPVFSCHAKLVGNHLTSADYAALNDPQRRALASTLGRFYADLHATPDAPLRSAGALPIKPWLSPADVCATLPQTLSDPLKRHALAAAAAFADLSPDPHGETYGYFDGHGWNMAFDHGTGVLNGVYDFADSGFGPLHQEFVYPGFVARDLTVRIVAAYQVAAHRTLDMQRIDLLTCYLRLSELAQAVASGDDPAPMVDNLAHWAEATGGLYRWSLR